MYPGPRVSSARRVVTSFTVEAGRNSSSERMSSTTSPVSMSIANEPVRQEADGEGRSIAWEAPPKKINPWQAEWNVFLDAIRNDRPHNEARQAAMSQAADIMGRAAIHMGRVITMDEVMASNFEWVKGGVDNLNENSPPPVVADADGHYPVPVPGQWVEV